MRTPHLTVGGWFRLLITHLAVICSLVGAVQPFPADAHRAGLGENGLTLPGASLCQANAGGEHPSPVQPTLCDHCPICAFSHHSPPLLTLAEAVPIIFPAADASRAMALQPRTGPRAPSGWSHAPRAPPAA